MPDAVGVVGGGSWGTAIAKLLGENGHEVCFWMRDPEAAAALNATRRNPRYLSDVALPQGVRATASLSLVGQECPVVFMVVPSHGLREVARELGDHLDGRHVLIHGTKGIEPGTFMRMSEILRQETCCRKIGVLSGPNLAREIVDRQPSAAVIASRFDEVVQAGRSLLWSSSFRVYGSNDVVGVEIAGALKNVMAIAAGLAQGLGFQMNTMALLVTRGLAEIARLGVRQGARVETFAGLAGVGDLMATCFSPLSRNFQVGNRLAAGETLESIAHTTSQVAEGVKTTRTTHDLARDLEVYMPITTGVHRILFDAADPRQVLAELMDISRYVYEQEVPAIKR